MRICTPGVATPRLAAYAVATLLPLLAACGETADPADPGSVASDPTASASDPSEQPTASAEPTTPSAPAPDLALIDTAVAEAIEADFPALVPTGLERGWTVRSAQYAARGGGDWRIGLTDARGEPVGLTQSADRPVAMSVIGEDAEKAGTVDLDRSGLGTWQRYDEADGSRVHLVGEVARTVAAVSAPDLATAKQLARRLLVAEDAGAGTGDG